MSVDAHPRAVRLAVAAIVALGLAARGAHYARDYPMWHDEAAPVLNVLAKSYGELWGPRIVNATEPPLTLWIYKATSQYVSDEPWALRLPSLLASCAALILGVIWFRRWLGSVGWIALAIMTALSDRLLFHACEAKTYSFDVLLAVVFLKIMTWDTASLTRADLSRWRTVRRQCLAVALMSPLVFLCYPLVFMLVAFGAVQTVSLAAAWRDEESRAEVRGTLLTFSIFGVVSGLCAFILVTVTLRGIQTASVVSCWAPEFPDFNVPARIPLQLLGKVLDTFRYAQAPVGQVLLLATIIGGVALVRGGHSRLVAWFGLVFAINAAAWLAGKYPLGHYRVVAYMMPAIFLFAARGIDTASAALARQRVIRLALAAAMVAVCIGQTAYRFRVSWTRLDSVAPIQFVLAHRGENEPVVGDLWEQQYYLRKLGPLGRIEPPDVNDEGIRSFWYIGNTRDLGPDFLTDYPASGKWLVSSRTDFKHFAALRFERRDAPPFRLVSRP